MSDVKVVLHHAAIKAIHAYAQAARHPRALLIWAATIPATATIGLDRLRFSFPRPQSSSEVQALDLALRQLGELHGTLLELKLDAVARVNGHTVLLVPIQNGFVVRATPEFSSSLPLLVTPRDTDEFVRSLRKPDVAVADLVPRCGKR